MSILLDALKKSEAQRQLGQTPTLQTTVLGEEFSFAGNRVWIPAVMLLVTAVVIGWISAAQFRRPETVAGMPAATPVVSEQKAVAEPAAPGPANSAERSAKTPAKTPVMDFAVAAPPPVSHRAPRKSSMTAARKKTSQLKETVEPVSASRQQATVDSPAAAPDRTPDRAAETPEKKTERLEPYVTESISYWQVPESVRQEMPEMHITVLVYAEKPEDRFLLVNGERLHEKEELSEGLVLEEIQRDGAIFSFRKYRFHLKN